MAEKKLTKRDYFSRLRGIVANDSELVAFIDHELELLDRKNSSKGQTKTQKENELVKEVIVAELSRIGSPVTITDMQTASEKLAEYSNQKLSALLKQLVESKDVVKTTDKKKSYFSVA